MLIKLELKTLCHCRKEKFFGTAANAAGNSQQLLGPEEWSPSFDFLVRGGSVILTTSGKLSTSCVTKMNYLYLW